jgi:hypothetical protein
MQYILAILAAIILGLGIYVKILSSELKTAVTINKTVDIIGQIQEKHTKEEDKQSLEHKETVDEKYSSNIAALQHTNRRLRDELARGRLLPKSAAICSNGGTRTSVDWPLIDNALRDYAEEARSIAESGDAAIQGLNAVKEWYRKETN